MGGYSGIFVKYPLAIPESHKEHYDNGRTIVNNNSHCGRPTEAAFHLIRDISDPQYPWTGVIFGLTISGIWYWCSDQVCLSMSLLTASLDDQHNKNLFIRLKQGNGDKHKT